MKKTAPKISTVRKAPAKAKAQAKPKAPAKAKAKTPVKPKSKAKTKPKAPTLKQLEDRKLRADVEWKEERVAMAKIKREKEQGKLITREGAQESAVLIIRDMQSEIMSAVDGIAKAKLDQVEEIFKKYLS